MDPNASLKNIRKIITEWNETDDTGDATELLDELSTAVGGLDDWLTMGAFLPDAWKYRTGTPSQRPVDVPTLIAHLTEYESWETVTLNDIEAFLTNREEPVTPKLIVVTDEDGMLHLKCPDPDCGTLDDIAEVDKAVRVNRNSGFEFDDEGKLVALWWGTGDGDYEHDHYQCDTCLLIVDLPEATDHQALSQEWN